MAKLNRVSSDDRNLNQVQDNVQQLADQITEEASNSVPNTVQVKDKEYRVNGNESILFCFTEANPITILLQEPDSLTSRRRLTIIQCTDPASSHALTVKCIKQGAEINRSSLDNISTGAKTYVSDGSRYWSI